MDTITYMTIRFIFLIIIIINTYIKNLVLQKTLQISYIGMQTQEVAIKPNLKVVLRSDAQQIDEVVVTA
ncbi:hypothetical protein, partial [Bacteroides thetaiotaomicron]|uniref:hypothetical protein n=1 Tax=Bacteroides thetaiotaomicron TaxID=818 RepID=UPI0039C0A9D7